MAQAPGGSGGSFAKKVPLSEDEVPRVPPTTISKIENGPNLGPIESDGDDSTTDRKLSASRVD